MKKYYYLFTLVFVFVIPTMVAGYFLRDTVTTERIVPFVVLVTLIGSIWDIWATKHRSKDPIWLWQFNDKQTLGIKVLGLPIEEYMFYIASSTYVIYMWEGIKNMTQNNGGQLYIVVALLTLWTLIGILLPYKFGPRGDKLTG